MKYNEIKSSSEENYLNSLKFLCFIMRKIFNQMWSSHITNDQRVESNVVLLGKRRRVTEGRKEGKMKG